MIEVVWENDCNIKLRSAGGHYVLYTDYQAAEARIAELEAEIKRLNDKYDFQLLVKRNEKLEQANKIMREALGYLNGEHGIAAPAMVKSHQVVIPEALNQADKILGE